jgi:trimethylamine--corrinoid protein Co-methyltransferase
MYAELYASPLKAVIDDDVVGMVKRLMRGIDTSEEGLSLELIQETGPIPGSFMDSDETLLGWREECYIPTVSSRTGYEEWKNGGKKDVIQNAGERTEKLLKEQKVQTLPADQEQALEDILNDARQYYYKTGKITEEEWKAYQEDIHSPNYPFA